MECGDDAFLFEEWPVAEGSSNADEECGMEESESEEESFDDMEQVFGHFRGLERLKHPYFDVFENESVRYTEAQLSVRHDLIAKSCQETRCFYINVGVNFEAMLMTLQNETEIGISVELELFSGGQQRALSVGISTEREDFVIDAISLQDQLPLLGLILFDHNIVKVVYNAEPVLYWFQDVLNLYLVNVFDVSKARECFGLEGASSLDEELLEWCGGIKREHPGAVSREQPLLESYVRYYQMGCHYLLHMYHDAKNSFLQLNEDKYVAFLDKCNNLTKFCHKDYLALREYREALVDLEAYHSLQSATLQGMEDWRCEKALISYRQADDFLSLDSLGSFVSLVGPDFDAAASFVEPQYGGEVAEIVLKSKITSRISKPFLDSVESSFKARLSMRRNNVKKLLSEREVNSQNVNKLMTQVFNSTTCRLDRLIPRHPFFSSGEVSLQYPEEQFKPAKSGEAASCRETSCSFIDNTETFNVVLEKLQSELELGIGVEVGIADSELQMLFVNISTNSEDFVLDAQVLKNELKLLGGVFYNKTIVKVLYKAEQVLYCFQQVLGLYFVNIFDITRAVKCFNIVDSKLSLGFRGRPKDFKSSERPFPRAWLHYCQSGSHYLLGMYHFVKNLALGGVDKLGGKPPDFYVQLCDHMNSLCTVNHAPEFDGLDEFEAAALDLQAFHHFQNSVLVGLNEWRWENAFGSYVYSDDVLSLGALKCLALVPSEDFSVIDSNYALQRSTEVTNILCISRNASKITPTFLELLQSRWLRKRRMQEEAPVVNKQMKLNETKTQAGIQKVFELGRKLGRLKRPYFDMYCNGIRYSEEQLSRTALEPHTQNCQFVQNVDSFSKMILVLLREKELALGIEVGVSSSKLRVLYISISGKCGDYVLDAVALQYALPIFGKIIRHPEIVKVLNEAEPVLYWFQQVLNLHFVNIFDISKARNCFKTVSDSTLSHKTTRRPDLENNTDKPLPEAWLRYYQSTSHTLLRVYHKLKNYILDEFGESDYVAFLNECNKLCFFEHELGEFEEAVAELNSLHTLQTSILHTLKDWRCKRTGDSLSLASIKRVSLLCPNSYISTLPLVNLPIASAEVTRITKEQRSRVLSDSATPPRFPFLLDTFQSTWETKLNSEILRQNEEKLSTEEKRRSRMREIIMGSNTREKETLLQNRHPFFVGRSDITVPYTDEQLQLSSRTLKLCPIQTTPRHLVDTPETLAAMLEALQSSTEIGISSVITRTTPATKQPVQFVSISSNFADYVVDAAALRDHIHLLSGILYNHKILKVMYDSRSVLHPLQQILRLYFVNIFDIQTASECLLRKPLGTCKAEICARYAGIEELDDDPPVNMFAKQRPMPERFLKCLQRHSHYLLDMYRAIKDEVLENGRSADYVMFLNECNDLCRFEQVPVKVTFEEALRDVEGYHSLQNSTLQLLDDWRRGSAFENHTHPDDALSLASLKRLALLLPTDFHHVANLADSHFDQSTLERIQKIICREKKTCTPLRPFLNRTYYRLTLNSKRWLEHVLKKNQAGSAALDFGNSPETDTETIAEHNSMCHTHSDTSEDDVTLNEDSAFSGITDVSRSNSESRVQHVKRKRTRSRNGWHSLKMLKLENQTATEAGCDRAEVVTQDSTVEEPNTLPAERVDEQMTSEENTANSAMSSEVAERCLPLPVCPQIAVFNEQTKGDVGESGERQQLWS